MNTTAVLSAVGSTINTEGGTLGQMKVSPNGLKLAMATQSNSVPQSAGHAGFTLFDFDPATGVVSNGFQLYSELFSSGIEFSPDGSKLYGVVTAPTGSVTAKLFQWNICAGSNAAIASSQYSVGVQSASAWGIQWAIDGKLYISNHYSTTINVINNPTSLVQP